VGLEEETKDGTKISKKNLFGMKSRLTGGRKIEYSAAAWRKSLGSKKNFWAAETHHKKDKRRSAGKEF